MGRKEITVRDVAREAGVSIATVSRVINGRIVPGNSTAKKVLEAVENIGYVIKQQPVVEQRHRTILAIIHDKNVAYFDSVLDGVQRSALELGYDVVVHVLRNNKIDANYFIRLAGTVSACGILFVSACVPTDILSEVELSIPVVKCVDVLDDDDNITCIGINDRSAFRKLTSYLISIGRTRIALLQAPLKGEISRYHEEGYREAMIAAGLEICPEWISPMIQRETSAEVADFNQIYYFIKMMMDLPVKPNAIICNIDTDAAMVIKAAFKLKLNVPTDLVVAGFYNLMLAKLTYPELTSVETHAADIGFTAMKLLDERISNPTLPHTRLYTNAEIIIRNSTSTF